MRKSNVVLLLLVGACVEEGGVGDEGLGQEEQELHGPVVVAGGPKSTGMVRFHDCLGCRGSSTLVRRDMVLTNKHVVNWTGTANMFVNFTNTPYTGGTNYQVINKWESPTADLAILQLKCSIGASVAPVIALSTDGNDDYLHAGKVTLVGYGPTTWSGTDYGVKRQGGIALPTTPAAFTWASTSWSTSGLVGSAPGDSGGSLYFDIAGTPRLGGVITWGSPTDSSHYAAGQRVDLNLGWIQPILTTTPYADWCPIVGDPYPPEDK